MLKKLIQTSSIVILLIFFSSKVWSHDVNSITFKKYSSASCSYYSGTWTGTLNEVTTGVSFPVTISLHNKDNKIIGKVLPVQGRFMRDEIWADCKDGNLSNIFWGRKDTCGGYSQEGFLLNKNIMALKVHYESINEDTDFVILLKKKDSDYPYPLPTKADEYNLGIVRTCH